MTSRYKEFIVIEYSENTSYKFPFGKRDINRNSYIIRRKLNLIGGETTWQ